MESIGTIGLWGLFFAFVITVCVTDLVVLNGRRSQSVTTRKAFVWTLVWVACALAFNGLLWLILLHTQGHKIAGEKALEFLTGYLVEKTLSIDNMFVILMIFQYFTVPPELQRRVLMYGVIGAFVLRFIMIFFGVWIVNQFQWILYVFGIFLLITGLKMFAMGDEKKDLRQSSTLNWLRKNVRLTEQFENENFFIFKNQLWYATPLFLALVFIELSDAIFALDSIPAIFGITRDPFIIFTSNMFAILGLRALYFLLANLAARFHLLKYGVACILLFIGGKMLLEHWVHVSALFSLGIIIGILAITVLLSFLREQKR